jgi:hypothetical protein
MIPTILTLAGAVILVPTLAVSVLTVLVLIPVGKRP